MKAGSVKKIDKGNGSDKLNIATAAAYIGVKKSYMYKLVFHKRITHYKPGGKVIIFLKSDLDQYLSRNKVAAIAA